MNLKIHTVTAAIYFFKAQKKKRKKRFSVLQNPTNIPKASFFSPFYIFQMSFITVVSFSIGLTHNRCFQGTGICREQECGMKVHVGKCAYSC